MTLRIELTPTDLVTTRFAVAPLAELNQLLARLDRRGDRSVTPALRGSRWAQRYRPLRGGLDARALHALRPGKWGPDLVAPPPTGMVGSVRQDLAVVRSTPPAVARPQIERALAETGTVDDDVRALLTGRGFVGRVAGVLERMWDSLLAPDWPQLRAITERDVLHSADRLVRGGWGAAFEDVLDVVRWDGQTLLVRRGPNETVRPDGRGLLLVPSVFIHPHVAVTNEPPWQPTIIYPARGSAALWEKRPVAPRALGRLLGESRATVLLELERPASTTQLSRSTGTALGSVGDHLRTLLDAGLVERGRAGRSVVYRRTAVGDALVGATSA